MSVLHDSPDARVVLFRFEPGQAIPLHRTPSAVTLRVLQGSGVITRTGEQRVVGEGSSLAFAAHEAYAVRAGAADSLTVLATIRPSPSTR